MHIFIALRDCIFLFIAIRTVGAQNLSDPTIPQEKCNCSSDISRTKCFLRENWSSHGLTCTIEYDETEGNGNSSFTCINLNDISLSLAAEYDGPQTNITLYCQVLYRDYRLKLDFNGMLPHESLRIWHYRRRTSNQMVSSFRAKMQASPESTGLYTVNVENVETGFRYLSRILLNISVHYGKNGQLLKSSKQIIAPIVINDTTFALPCKTLSPEGEISVQKDGKNFTEFLVYLPTIGFIIKPFNQNFSSFFGLYVCFSTSQNRSDRYKIDDDFVKIKVDEETLMPAIRKQDRNYTKLLKMNATSNWISCSSVDKENAEFRFVNVRMRSPAEVPLREGCFNKDTNCVGQREASFSNCTSSKGFSKCLTIEEGGGIFSCFETLSGVVTWHEYVVGLNKLLYYDLTSQIPPLDALFRVDIPGQESGTLYTNIMYNVACTAVGYLIAKPLEMTVTLQNGTRIVPSFSELSDELFESTSDYGNIIIGNNIMFSNEDTISVVCEAFWWNSDSTLRKQLSFIVSQSIKPKFAETSEKITLVYGRKSKLTCDYEAKPDPSIVWERNGKQLDDETGRYLYFHKSAAERSGEYVCIVKNAIGSAVKNFTVNVLEPEDASSIWYVVAISGFAIGLCFVFGGLLLKYYKKARVGLSKAEISDFLNGAPVTTCSSKSQDGNEIVSSMPYAKEYEISDGDFSLDEQTLLGSGAYGIVYRGKIRGTDVAIKTLKRNAETSYLRSILSELRVMIYLKGHPNLVNLLGANTKHLKKGGVYLMVELCTLGSLENYLRKNRDKFFDEFSILDYSNVKDSNCGSTREGVISTTHLLQWCIHISSAMEYLFSKKVIHGDLAVRNVLLQNDRTAKVSDFGFSRKLYEYSSYMKQSKGPLPWRHMALESLKDLKFSTESDVWAFGVTTWEIFSLGEVPYPGLNWNVDFVQMLEAGFRMKSAKFSNNQIFDLQIQCWNSQENLRPNFSEIREKFELLTKCLHENCKPSV